jgi:hypothetical protein
MALKLSIYYKIRTKGNFTMEKACKHKFDSTNPSFIKCILCEKLIPVVRKGKVNNYKNQEFLNLIPPFKNNFISVLDVLKNLSLRTRS